MQCGRDRWEGTRTLGYRKIPRTMTPVDTKSPVRVTGTIPSCCAFSCRNSNVPSQAPTSKNGHCHAQSRLLSLLEHRHHADRAP